MMSRSRRIAVSVRGDSRTSCGKRNITTPRKKKDGKNFIVKLALTVQIRREAGATWTGLYAGHRDSREKEMVGSNLKVMPARLREKEWQTKKSREGTQKSK